MAKSLSAKKGRRSPTTRRRSARSKNGSARDDAVRLLKADHREVEGLFGEFQRTRSDERREEVAAQICQALRAHTTIEEEIFYPAFLESTGDTAITTRPRSSTRARNTSSRKSSPLGPATIISKRASPSSRR